VTRTYGCRSMTLRPTVTPSHHTTALQWITITNNYQQLTSHDSNKHQISCYITKYALIYDTATNVLHDFGSSNTWKPTVHILYVQQPVCCTDHWDAPLVLRCCWLYIQYEGSRFAVWFPSFLPLQWQTALAASRVQNLIFLKPKPVFLGVSGLLWAFLDEHI